jgi:uncharacterized protein YidB (DUF937 family)
MGLFDQVAGAIGAASGSASEPGSRALAGIMELINNPQTGGLAGLVQSFHAGGLSDVVNSWISGGTNLPISAEQIQRVLGNEQIAKIAAQLGINTDQASAHLAEFLPQVIDNLTPNGALPQGGSLVAEGLELLKSKLLG